MKAKMTVERLELRNIMPISGSDRMGHNFELVAKVKVHPRSLGPFSGEGIDCPNLQWIETVDWYSLDPHSKKWIHVGTNPYKKDLYQSNPRSQTFITWSEDYRYAFAREVRGFPLTLKNASMRDIKHWIARNGLEWELPIRDIPSMGLQGGSRGGAGASLVISNTRRRVIRFDLGFSGYPQRIHCTQILESQAGRPTINVFLRSQLTDLDLTNPHNLEQWRRASTR